MLPARHRSVAAGSGELRSGRLWRGAPQVLTMEFSSAESSSAPSRSWSPSRGTSRVLPYDPQRHGPQRIVGPGFHEQVYRLVARVPRGRVTTYGDVAAALGSVGVARQVGWALAALPAGRGEVPWHRVVNARGRLSARSEGERPDEQERRLLAEGVSVEGGVRVAEFARIRFRFSNDAR